MTVKTNLPVNNLVFKKLKKYEDSYRGYVIDRNDEHGIGRIKVWIPQLMAKLAESRGIWVRPRPITESFHCIPNLNQWVEVKFENGDLQLGYYLGVIIHIGEHIGEFHENSNRSLSNKAVAPFSKSEESKLDPIARRKTANSVFMRSPIKRHLIQFQDDDDLNFAEIRSGSGQNLVMNDKTKYLQLKSIKENSLLFDDERNLISLRSNSNHFLQMDDDSQNIALKSKNGNGIVLDDAGSCISISTKPIHSSIKEKSIDLCNTTEHYNPKTKKISIIDSQTITESVSKHKAMPVNTQGLLLDNTTQINHLSSNLSEIFMIGTVGFVLINPRSL